MRCAQLIAGIEVLLLAKKLQGEFSWPMPSISAPTPTVLAPFLLERSIAVRLAPTPRKEADAMTVAPVRIRNAPVPWRHEAEPPAQN
jgi:hypothetical protein